MPSNRVAAEKFRASAKEYFRSLDVATLGAIVHEIY